MNIRKHIDCVIYLLIAAMQADLAAPAAADQYYWIGSGAWSDENNWNVPTNPDNNLPPDGDDEAYFYQSSSVNVDSSTGVKVAVFGIGTYSLSLGGTALSVNNLNLFHVGDGGSATVNASGGGTLSPHGTLIGATSGSTGTLDLSAGVRLSDATEISVGYTGTGTLKVSGGSQATSAGAIFLGGFQTGNGTVNVSGSGSTVSAANSYIAIGNEGSGTLDVQSGGAVSAKQIILGGFPSGSGEATVAGGSSASTITASEQFSIGHFGDGRMFVENGGKISGKSVVVGNGSTSDGGLIVSGNNATVDAGADGFYAGLYGHGYASFIGGAKLNVPGGAALGVGVENGSDGSLVLSGQGSRISAGQTEMHVGLHGAGELTLTDRATIDAEALVLESPSSGTSSASVSGFAIINVQRLLMANGHTQFDVINSGQVMTSLAVVGTGELSNTDAKMAVRGNGSTLSVTNDLSVGLVAGQASLTIEAGGKVSAHDVNLGSDSGANGTLTVDGSASTLEASSMSIGYKGHGTLQVRNGAAVTVPSDLLIASDEGAQGDLIVENSNSSLALNGFSPSSGQSSITVRDHATATNSRELDLDRSTLTIDSAGAMTSSGALKLGVSHDSTVTVMGASSSFDVAGAATFGKDANATITVSAGGAMNAHVLQQRAASQASSSAASELHVLGAGSRFTADSLFLTSSSNKVEVTSGGHAWFRNSLELGRTTLSLSGGSIDVGFLLGAPQANVIRVGLGGYLSSDHPLPAVRNSQGTVHVGGSPGTMTIAGDFTQDVGSILSFSVTGTTPGTEYSQLVVDGNLNVQGTIRISFEDGFSPLAGQTFDLITVAGTKQLSNYHVEIGTLAPGFMYSFAPSSGGYRLTALSSGQVIAPVAGDFNGDGAVDGVDLTRWRVNYGLASGASHRQGDANADGRVDGADFAIWQRQLATQSGAVVSAPVPEPGLIYTAASVCVQLTLWRKRRLASFDGR